VIATCGRHIKTRELLEIVSSGEIMLKHGIASKFEDNCWWWWLW